MSFNLDWEEENPIADKNYFVDRNEFREILTRAVEDPQPLTEWRAVSFYGAGGQGKSALKNDFFIRNYLAKAGKHVLYTDRVDFEDQPKTRLADEAMLRIAQDLIEKGHIALPAFCLGFVRYKMLTSAEKNIQQDYPFLFKIKFIESEVANEVFNTIITTTVDILVAGSLVIPGVNYFSKKASEKGHQKIVEWIQKSDAKSVLGDIDDLNAHQLLYRLPLLLAYDINKFLRRGVTREQPYPSKRIIIIFDGYETLWRDSLNADSDKDSWVRMLIEKTPGVLFVIFGREELRWAERDDTYNKILKQYRLSGIADADADELLKLQNVDEEHVRKQIIQSSKTSKTPEEGCLPFYLDLQVKTYHRMAASGRAPEPSDFEKNDDDVIHHFFEHIPFEVAGAIKALSLAPYIDEEIIELFVSNTIIVPDAVSLSRLSRYSFIRMDGKRGIVHGLVKDLALKQYRSEYEQRLIRIQKLLFAHFQSKLANILPAFSSDAERYLEISAAHKEQFDPEEYLKFVLTHTPYVAQAPRLLIGLLERAREVYIRLHPPTNRRQVFTTKDIPLSKLTDFANIDFYICQAYIHLEEYHNAYKHADVCMDTLTRRHPTSAQSVPSDPNPDEQHVLNAVTKLKMETAGVLAKTTQRLEWYSETKLHYKTARTHSETLNIEFPFEFEYAKYCSDVGLFAEAEPILFSFYKKKRNTQSGANEGAHELAIALSRQQRYDEAIPFHLENLKVLKEAGMTGHELYADGLLALANTLVDQGIELDEAGRLYDEIFEINRRKYDEDHLKFGYFFIGLSRWHMARRDIENAGYYFEKGASILREKIGPLSKALIEGLVRKALLEAKLRENGEITEKQYRAHFWGASLPWSALPAIIDSLGVYHPLLHSYLKMAGDDFERVGDKMNETTAKKILEEYDRHAKRLNNIRLDRTARETVLEGYDKARQLDRFHDLLSLPRNIDHLEVSRIDLSFLRTFKLYKIKYLNTSLDAVRYIFDNGDRVLPMDYTVRPVYYVATHDGEFDDSNIYSYCQFYFESIVLRNNGITAMFDADDVPWRRDVTVNAAERDMINATVKQVRIVENTDDYYLLELFMMCQDTLLRTGIMVYKREYKDDSTTYLKADLRFVNQSTVLFLAAGQPIFFNPSLGGENKGEGHYTANDELIDVRYGDLIIAMLSASSEPSFTYSEHINHTREYLTEALNLAHISIKLMLDMFDQFGEREHSISVLSCRTYLRKDIAPLLNENFEANIETFEKWFSALLQLIDQCISIAEQRRNTIQWQLATLRNNRAELVKLGDQYVEGLKEWQIFFEEHRLDPNLGYPEMEALFAAQRVNKKSSAAGKK